MYDFDKTKLRDDAIKAYVDGLDEPYTHYYTQSEFSSYISNIQDGYVGIGIIVGVNDDNQMKLSHRLRTVRHITREYSRAIL